MLALALWCLAPGGRASAGVTYDVTVDTSSLSGTTGLIDFQFNPANASSLAATGVVAKFNTDGTLIPPPSTLGDVSGSLPGSLTFVNDQPTNDYNGGFTYGNSISFDVTLSGPALSGGAPPGATSTFSFTLYDSSGNPTSTGPGGSIVTIVINEGGSTTGTAYSSTASVNPQVVPEPATLLLSVISIGTLSGWYKLRRRAAA
jgi:hypothetical protein